MRYFIIALSIMFASCATIKPLPGSKTFNAYDFTEYSDEGFLFSPEGYNKDYISVGIVNVTFWPEVVRSGETEPGISYGIESDMDGNQWFVEKIDIQAAIDSMYTKAKDMGADAVIRFNDSYNIKQHGSINIVGVELNGFAIKRIDPKGVTFD